MIKALARLQSLAATEAEIARKGKANLKQLLAAVRAVGIKLGKPDDNDFYDILGTSFDTTDSKACKAAVLDLISKSGWTKQKGVKFPDAEGNFFLEAPVGDKGSNSQAVVNFQDKSFFALAIGNW